MDYGFVEQILMLKNYYYDQDLKGPLGIVIGNEGQGMSEKVKEKL